MRLPIQLQRAMAAEAEASREARAKVIAAEGEQKASRALREASEVIGDSPAALQLRYLQVSIIILIVIPHICNSINVVICPSTDIEHNFSWEELDHRVPVAHWFDNILFKVIESWRLSDPALDLNWNLCMFYSYNWSYKNAVQALLIHIYQCVIAIHTHI